MKINPPPNDSTTSAPWATWFTNMWRIAASSVSSGTTAQRPTRDLWIGRYFWDSTLGKPVFVKSLGPTVWVDGAGTVS